MDKKEEIEFLIKLRNSAQEMVDKITIRIVEIQNEKEDKIGFKK